MEFPWNERFQMLLERPSMTPEEGRQRHTDIEGLAEEFIDKARGPVRTIVTELSTPESNKLIKPVAVGGVAGGSLIDHARHVSILTIRAQARNSFLRIFSSSLPRTTFKSSCMMVTIGRRRPRSTNLSR
jgi:hypothetical protein